MEWLDKLVGSAGAAGGIVLSLGLVIGWLLKDRTRLLAELNAEREKREAEHTETRRLMTTYERTLEGLARRLQDRIRSPRS